MVWIVYPSCPYMDLKHPRYRKDLSHGPLGHLTWSRHLENVLTKLQQQHVAFVTSFSFWKFCMTSLVICCIWWFHCCLHCVLVHRFSSWRSWMYWLLEFCWYTLTIQHLSLSLPHYPPMSLISSLSSTLTISPSHSCTLSYFTSLSLSPSLNPSTLVWSNRSKVKKCQV